LNRKQLASLLFAIQIHWTAMANKKDSLRLMTLDVSAPDDDASVVSTATTSVELAKYAPMNAPLSWFVVNAVLFLWSLLQVIEIVMDSTLYPLYRTQLYLLWNFGTTFCWCTEVVLTALAHTQEAQRTENAQGNSWATILELVLAIYFTIDSIHLFQRWRKPDGDIVGELFDATLNTIGYCYLMLKAKPLTLLASKVRHQKYEVIV
jgi:hypothetical protein